MALKTRMPLGAADFDTPIRINAAMTHDVLAAVQSFRGQGEYLGTDRVAFIVRWQDFGLLAPSVYATWTVIYNEDTLPVLFAGELGRRRYVRIEC